LKGDFKNGDNLTIRLLNGGIHKLDSKSFRKFLITEKVAMSQAGVLYFSKK